MKKRILNFALLISIMTSLFVGIAVSATETTMPVSIKSVYCYYVDNTVNATVNFDYVNEAGTMFLAVYDGGKLVNLKQESIVADESKKAIIMENADENYLGYDVKVFCWGRDNWVTPISTHFDVEFETEIVVKLKLVSDEIDLYTDRSNPALYTKFNNTERYMLNKINTCIDDAVANYADELDADFIEKEYEEEIKDVKDVYDGMTEEAREAFKGKMAANFDTDNLIWIAETLGIDLSDYGINTEDYV